MPRYLRVRMINLKPASPGTDIRADIVRLGEFMTPQFSVRNRLWLEHEPSEKRNASMTVRNTNAYAEKLIRE